MQLRCFIHLKRNLQSKMKEYGLPMVLQEEFLAYIFRKRRGNSYEEGLVDSVSCSDFDHKLEQVMPIWDDKQAPYHPTSGPLFSTYVCTYVSDVIKYHMRKDIRVSWSWISSNTIYNKFFRIHQCMY